MTLAPDPIPFSYIIVRGYAVSISSTFVTLTGIGLANPLLYPPLDSNLQWIISQIPNTNFVKIWNLSSSGWLYGSDNAGGGSSVYLYHSDRNTDTDVFLQWQVYYIRKNIYALKSVYTKSWLDGRADWKTQYPKVSQGSRVPAKDTFLQFEISRIIF
jgi:hypothetical protein